MDIHLQNDANAKPGTFLT